MSSCLSQRGSGERWRFLLQPFGTRKFWSSPFLVVVKELWPFAPHPPVNVRKDVLS
jgi:hypothetical protein